jgi:uncharacterized protein YprB with RNaseH-like and TPR domain
MNIVAWDLECSSLSAMVGRILCCGFKQVSGASGAGKPYVFRGDEAPYFNKKDLADDSKLAVAIRDELEKYDCVIAHNGKLFDRKFLNARLLKAGERPLKPIFFIDPMWIVRSHFRTSSKLDNVQQFLGLPDEKTKITWDDWQRAMSGDKKSMNIIVKHVIQDVVVLEQAYWRLLPAMRTLAKS